MKILRWLCIALIGLVLALLPASSTTAASTRPTHYYLVDRVRSNTDFATLASWGINTAVVDMYVNGTTSSWQSVLTAASNAGVNIVIWPDQTGGSDVDGCRWENPFNNPQNGDYIWSVKPMLDAIGSNPHVIGIVSAHEPEWATSACRTSVNDMATIKTQLKNYMQAKGRTDFKVWNFIDNITDLGYGNTADYSGPADIPRIMDVAVTWQHCAGNAESSCDVGSNSALARINNDRARLTAAGLNGTVELVFIMQTFTTSSPYSTRFTLPQLENYSCEFLNTSALDGFGSI